VPWIASEPIRVLIPGPPRALGRQRHRIVRPRGKPEFVGNYMDAETANVQSIMRDFAFQQMRGRPPFEGAIDLRFVAYMPIAASWSKKKQEAARLDQIRPTGSPDFDNCVKMIDAFKKILWRDDGQITDGYVWKRYSDRPRLAVEVRFLSFE
jgi:Holliday junction resolvase RusA-like endonuclease